MKSGSNLEKVLASGKPAVTAELGPPMSADGHEVVKKAQLLKGFCDAANITDCQTAVVRISSIAAATIAYQNGLEPVMQIAARERTRMGVQSTILGAAALGIRNVLCLTGDHPRMGPSPHGRRRRNDRPRRGREGGAARGRARARRRRRGRGTRSGGLGHSPRRAPATPDRGGNPRHGAPGRARWRYARPQ